MPIPSRNGELADDDRVRRSLRKNEVFDHLFAAILDGTLKPGERIRDSDLQVWLDVSRTPIRLALDRLESLRLVETVPNRFTRVSAVGPDRVLPLVDVLCGLWSLAVRLTITRLDADRETECRALLETATRACLTRRGDDATATATVESVRAALAFFSENSGNALLPMVVAKAGAAMRFQLGPQGALLDAFPLAQFFSRLDRAVAQRDASAADEAVHFLQAQARDACRVAPRGVLA